LRVLAPQPPSWLAIYRRHPVLPCYANQAGFEALVDTGESRWTVFTDERGFRIAPPPAREDGRPWALWLGDSFAFGHGVDFEQCFVGLLDRDPESALGFKDSAVCGYGPVQYRQTLEYLLDGGLRPRLVLAATFLGNDFLDCVWSKDIPVRDGIIGNEGGWKQFFRTHSHLYRLLSKWLHRVRQPELGQDFVDEAMADPQNWTQGELHRAEVIYREEFTRLAGRCSREGIPLAVMIIPRSTMVAALQEGTARGIEEPAGQTLAWKHARGILEDLGIRFLDLTPLLRQHPLSETFFPIDGHFTPRGHALVADAIRREWNDLLAPP